jgi:hypothetical protein
MSSPTFDATIKLWRLVDGANLYDRTGRELYWRGAMKLGSALQNARQSDDPVPVLVNHDDDRPIGVVRHLFNFVDTDGDWLCAACTVTSPPSWLKRGTAASICTQITMRSEENRVVRGYVPEVPVLSPGVRPAEPRAMVMSCKPSPEKTTRSSPASTRLPSARDVGEVFYGGGVIRRPGIGQVLAVGGVPVTRRSARHER